MKTKNRILVAGYSGMLGNSLIKLLNKNDKIFKISSKECDLTNQRKTLELIKKIKPTIIYLLAAKVGGIRANIKKGAEFIYSNLMIVTNVVNAAKENNVKKLIYVGSSCVYPKNAPQPFKENSLLTGELEKTNQYYAVAKISGIKLIEAYNKYYGTSYLTVMPPNLYGPDDNFHKNNSHVLSALLKKFVTAKKRNLKKVSIWGSKNTLREFLFVDDLSNALVFLKNKKLKKSIINVGSSKEISIQSLAKKIAKYTKYKGKIEFDKNKPAGVKRKIMNSAYIKKLGWKPKVSLDEGIKKTLDWIEKKRLF